jgi:hypothetical protein
MKVTERTHTRLTLHHKPIQVWFVSSLFAAICLVGTCLWLTEPALTRLECQRIQANYVTCQIHRSTVLNFENHQAINNVISVQESSRRSGKTWIYFLSLTTPSAQVAISNTERQTESLAQIAAFLNNPRSTSFKITYHRAIPIEQFIFASFFFLATLYFLATPIVTCTFYRSLQKLIIEKRSVLGKREQEYSLHDVQFVMIEEKKTRNGKLYFVVLWMKNNQRLRLPQEGSSDRHQQATIETNIKLFLDGQ